MAVSVSIEPNTMLRGDVGKLMSPPGGEHLASAFTALLSGFLPEETDSNVGPKIAVRPNTTLARPARDGDQLMPKLQARSNVTPLVRSNAPATRQADDEKEPAVKSEPESRVGTLTEPDTQSAHSSRDRNELAAKVPAAGNAVIPAGSRAQPTLAGDALPASVDMKNNAAPLAEVNRQPMRPVNDRNESTPKVQTAGSVVPQAEPVAPPATPTHDRKGLPANSPAESKVVTLGQPSALVRRPAEGGNGQREYTRVEGIVSIRSQFRSAPMTPAKNEEGSTAKDSPETKVANVAPPTRPPDNGNAVVTGDRSESPVAITAEPVPATEIPKNVGRLHDKIIKPVRHDRVQITHPPVNQSVRETITTAPAPISPPTAITIDSQPIVPITHSEPSTPAVTTPITKVDRPQASPEPHHIAQPPSQDDPPALPVQAASSPAPDAKSEKSAVAPVAAAIIAGPAAVQAAMPGTEPTQLSRPAQDQPAQAVDQDAPADQVMPVLVGMLKTTDGTQSVTIRLQPAELGQVQIRIDRSSEGTAHIDITTEKPETLQMLQRDQPRLDQALDQAGVLSTGRSVSFQVAAPEQSGAAGSRPDNTTSGSDGSRQDQSGGSGRQTSDSRREPENDPGPDQQQARARWFRAGLDITA
jgi:flagellar hook-length control protein FliK